MGVYDATEGTLWFLACRVGAILDYMVPRRDTENGNSGAGIIQWSKKSEFSISFRKDGPPVKSVGGRGGLGRDSLVFPEVQLRLASLRYLKGIFRDQARSWPIFAMSPRFIVRRDLRRALVQITGATIKAGSAQPLERLSDPLDHLRERLAAEPHGTFESANCQEWMLLPGRDQPVTCRCVPEMDGSAPENHRRHKGSMFAPTCTRSAIGNQAA